MHPIISKGNFLLVYLNYEVLEVKMVSSSY